jgi:hypothetical protein
LAQLETALRDRAKIEDAGWTNIAPQDIAGGPEWHSGPGGLPEGPGNFTTTDTQGSVVVTKRKPVMIRLDSKDVKDGNLRPPCGNGSGRQRGRTPRPPAARCLGFCGCGWDACRGRSNVVVRSSAPQDQFA